MHTQLVMTIIGADKPGLVESVSRVIEEHGGNWLESRMAHLAGQFAGILRVVVAEGRADDMSRALQALEAAGLHVVIERSTDLPSDQSPHRVRLELVGHDRPGIVHHITEVLAARGVNIEELASTLTSTPMSGGPMFTASAVLQVPQQLALDDLREDLERIAADLMVDINLCADQSP